jgi:hypothetical protein
VHLLSYRHPQIVLTWVAFSTFWLSPECGERLGLAVTIPLAVAVYDLLVFSSLPTSNRINFVSAMGLLGFLFSVAVLLENALVIQLYYYRCVLRGGGGGCQVMKRGETQLVHLQLAIHHDIRRSAYAATCSVL